MECTVSTVRAMSSCPSGVLQGHVDGQPVTRRPGLGGDPDRGGRAVEGELPGAAVGEQELVAGQGDDDVTGYGAAESTVIGMSACRAVNVTVRSVARVICPVAAPKARA